MRLKRSLLLGFLLSKITSVALSGTPVIVSVQEGEAETAVRIALQQNQAWQHSPQESTHSISLEGAVHGFIVQQAFLQTPVPRIRVLGTTTSEMSFEVMCHCDVLLQETPSLVTFTISPKHDTSTHRKETPELVEIDQHTPTASFQPHADTDFVVTAISPVSAGDMRATIIPRNTFPIVFDREPFRPQYLEQLDTTEDDRDAQTAGSELASGMILQEALRFEINRALEQRGETAEIENTPSNSTTEEVNEEKPENFALENAGSGKESLPSCESLNAIFSDLNPVTDPTEVFSEISRHRILSHQEFDRTNEGAMVDMARLYLTIGFGAEALQSLSEVEDNSTTSAMRYIAKAIDFPDHAKNLPHLALLNCDGTAAIWPLLYEQKILSQDDIERDKFLKILHQLPVGLRKVLTERIHKILHPNNNSKNEYSPNARTSRQTEDLARNSLSTPSQFLKYISNHFYSDEQIARDLLHVAQFFATQTRGTEDQDTGQKALAIALASQGKYLPAMHLLPDEEVSSSKDLQSDIFAHLIERADDATFLATMASLSSPMFKQMSVDALLKGSKRLKKLGFPHKALELIDAIPENARSDEVFLVLGQLSLDVSDVETAQAIAVRKRTSSFALLNARTLEASGDISSAVAAFRQLDKYDESEELIWRLDPLPKTLNFASPSLRILSELEQTIEKKRDPRVFRDKGSVTIASALLEKTESILTAVASLLE